MASLPTLNDYRAFMRFPDTYTDDDDLLLTWFIPAAQKAVEGLCGKVVSKTYDEYYDGGDYSIWLRHTPLINVQLVEEGWGFTNYDLEEIEVNSASMPTMFAFSIDEPNQGIISRRSGGNVSIPFLHGDSNIHIIYTAGREDVPEDISLACLSLVAIWYRNFEQQTATNAPMDMPEGSYQYDRSGGITSFDFGVPESIVLMLRTHRRRPIIG